MEVSIHKTAALFMAKAMAMPPPPPAPMARKRSLNEMSHAPANFLSSPPASLSLVRTKKTKSTLASTNFSFPIDDGCPECDDFDVLPPPMPMLSRSTEQYLAEDPFDYEALPHPVLQRQQAVLNVCEFYPAPNGPINSVNDDELIGMDLGEAPPALTPLPPRWNKSVVATSLSTMTRNPNVGPRTM